MQATPLVALSGLLPSAGEPPAQGMGALARVLREMRARIVAECHRQLLLELSAKHFPLAWDAHGTVMEAQLPGGEPQNASLRPVASPASAPRRRIDAVPGVGLKEEALICWLLRRCW